MIQTDLVRLGLMEPHSLASLTLRDWDLLIRQGRSAALLGKLYGLLEEQDLLHFVPVAPRNHLQGAWVIAASQERVIRWEVHCIERALQSVQAEFVLLKGAAYVLSKLPIARGRTQSDVDILVPKAKLELCESALLARGWIHVKLEKYDQALYRKWSHELPPLYHPDRGTVLDLHHNILPVSGRLHPDSEKLLAAAEAIPGTHYKRLSPPDMVLHASAHMFQDGDFERGIRELADIDGLIRAFSGIPRFFEVLVERAQELDLRRPLFYAVRYTGEFLKTPIPGEALSRIQSWGPLQPGLVVMDTLVKQALVPRPIPAAIGSGLASWLLYIRSHWLKMPPHQLVRHLIHQSLRTS